MAWEDYIPEANYQAPIKWGPLIAMGGTALGAAARWQQASIISGPMLSSIYSQMMVSEQMAQLAGVERSLALQQAQAQAEAASYNAALAHYSGEISRLVAGYNATTLEAEAKLAKDAAAYEVYKLRDAGAGLLAAQVNRYAKAGVQPGSGSPMDVYYSTTRKLDLEESALWFEGEVKAARLRNQAALGIWEGEVLATRAETQALADLRLADNYLKTGQIQANLADIKADVYRTQRQALGYQAEATRGRSIMTALQGGAQMLTGIASIANKSLG